MDVAKGWELGTAVLPTNVCLSANSIVLILDNSQILRDPHKLQLLTNSNIIPVNIIPVSQI